MIIYNERLCYNASGVPFDPLGQDKHRDALSGQRRHPAKKQINPYVKKKAATFNSLNPTTLQRSDVWSISLTGILDSGFMTVRR